MTDAALPDAIRDEEMLEDLLATPSHELIEFVRGLRGPLVILGAGGKMGPSLARRVRRAADRANPDLSIVAVSRFTNEDERRRLEECGIQTAKADLLDRAALASLPDAGAVVYLVGLKFGTDQDPSRTWAINTLVPTHAMERYAGTPFVALSTGNVYPLSPANAGGSVESDALTPIGEYPNAAVARERLFEYHSRSTGTPVTLIRLNYATDLRYGVLTDLARKVWAGEPIDVTNGHLNCIWQGDANGMIVRALALAESPPRPLNLTGSKTLAVRELAEEFGRLFDRPARIVGRESETALLSDSSASHRLLGEPAVPIETVIRWTAAWVRSGGRLLNQPTHFEVRDGIY